MSNDTLVSAERARELLDGATPGPWSVSEMHDGAAAECELGVVALDDPRSALKPDGTWHAAIVCRGMDGPTREGNADLIARAPDLARTVVELRAIIDDLAQTRHALDGEREDADELRAIIEGRTTAPSDEEIAAHAEHDGMWLVCPLGAGTPRFTIAPDLSYLGVCRVIPFDSDWCPCAWPVVGGDHA